MLRLVVEYLFPVLLAPMAVAWLKRQIAGGEAVDPAAVRWGRRRERKRRDRSRRDPRFSAEPVKEEDRFVRRELVSETERQFYVFLVRALPGYLVFPQVSMGALIDTRARYRGTGKWIARSAFSQKIVDFVVCYGGTLTPLAVIELDDVTHDRKVEKDEERDAMLRSAGYAVFRWDCRARPSAEEVFRAVTAGGAAAVDGAAVAAYEAAPAAAGDCPHGEYAYWMER